MKRSENITTLIDGIIKSKEEQEKPCYSKMELKNLSQREIIVLYCERTNWDTDYGNGHE